jgi:hypothetical protein
MNVGDKAFKVGDKVRLRNDLDAFYDSVIRGGSFKENTDYIIRKMVKKTPASIWENDTHLLYFDNGLTASEYYFVIVSKSVGFIIE